MVNWVDRLALLIGSGLVVYGVHMLSVPAAFIVAGLLLGAGALGRKR